DQAKVVYVACDAEERVIAPLLALCREKAVEVIRVNSMAELGRACGIEVGSAAAAIIEDGE
ncbi:MAG: ribosomal L7Ae/L30e/S12e/Gadd45 family protein, partial [Clostridia bacterium]|nr:ribosomal L7Ae/L30e/S12e/Gadd45 family protein [Clostridia bacterium]